MTDSGAGHSFSSSVAEDDLRAEVEAYLKQVLAALRVKATDHAVATADEAERARSVFSILTSRRFCYLSKKRVECYREDVITSLRNRIQTGEPFRFFYDIGPGYHATTRPGELPLRFDVGLSELLILFQIRSLSDRIRELYRPGVHFWLVIDNICGFRTNDVPLERTEYYVRQLRRLIDDIGMPSIVSLIVESEVFDLDEYDRLLAAIPRKAVHENLSDEAIDNVARFLGRQCTASEAAERVERYRRTSGVTDSLVDRLVRDVHMTQRATGATLGFRPFPGGDQRTQAGELVLTPGSKGRLRPQLVTSRNVDQYALIELDFPGLLPPTIPHVVYGAKHAAQ